MSDDYSRLFLGYPIDGDLQQLLEKIPEERRFFFIREGGEYLQQTFLNHTLLLGKFFEKALKLEHLDQLTANVISLLEQLIPTYCFDKNKLKLFSILKR